MKQEGEDRALDRRTRKRLATRQAISDAATRLIFEKGFDRVTIDEIAEAADVGRMTVFNHFPRKEDMFLDREQEIRDIAFAALRERDAGMSPIEAFRRLAHRMMEQPSPSFPLFEDTQRFVETAWASEALKSRAREMRDDFARALGGVLADEARRSGDDADAHLAAGLIAAAWSTAFIQSHLVMSRTGDSDVAKRTFLALIDRGMTGAMAAMAGTPYA